MSNARNLANLLGTSTQIKTAKVADEVFQANESLIINGDFAIAQRGTSISIAHDGDSANRNAYLLDRFLNSMNNAYDTFDGTLAQVSDAPEGFSNSLKWTTGTAEAAVDSNEYHNISHKIEAQNLQHLKYGTSDAKSVTVSFWVKASVTGTFCLSIYQSDGVRNITSTYTINSANTWEYKTVTFAGDTGGTINDDNGEGLRLQWHISAGSDLTSTDATSWGAYSGDRWAYGHAQNAIATTASATFQLAGCKMEVGSVATPFRHISYAENLALCKRYYQLWGTSDVDFQAYPMWTYTTGTSATYVDLAEEMRATPTVTRVGDPINTAGGQVAADKWAIYQTAWKGCAALTVFVPCKTGFRLDGTVNTAVTAGGACGLYGGTGCYYTLDAEL